MKTRINTPKRTRTARSLALTTDEADSEDLRLREKLRAALSSAALLEYSADELLADLKSAGLGTVERLAEALTTLARDARSKRVEPVLVNLAAIWNSPSSPSRDQIIHRPPKMAFVAAGVEYDPADIRRFDGRELCFVLGRRRRLPYLEVFEDKPFIKNWLHTVYLSRLAGGRNFLVAATPIPGPKQEEPGQEPPPPTQGSSGGSVNPDLLMFEHDLWRGDTLALGPGWAYPDLTRVGRGFLGMGDWNDIISSVLGPTTEAGFWEHINYEGSMFMFSDNVGHSGLEFIGWNDRISSVQHWG